MTPEDDPLRLGLAALRAGLIDGPQLARLAHAVGAGPEVPLAARLAALIGAEAVAALDAGTLAWVPPGPPAPELLAPDTLAATSDPVAPPGEMLALGLSPEVFARRYTLGAELGRGGVGVVVSARDALMGREVAVKHLHGPVDEVQRARFVAEARTTAQLDHPHIVPVHDFGQLRPGQPCFTMRRIRGRSLSEVLAAIEAGEPATCAEFSRYRLLQILGQICMAVDYAHAKGVVHRDLKPANIMLGDFGEVLVMDWGVAKVAGQRLTAGPGAQSELVDSSSAGATLQGGIMGTPGYMPPEQARGDLEAVDARSDVWALGALLYEILTGQRPFVGGSALSVLLATLQGEVEPPRRRAPERDIPADLEEICLRALAPQPARRYPGARALHAELERFLAGTREAERRQAEAARRVADGEESLWYIRTLEAERLALADALRAQPEASATEPLAAKRARWAIEDRARLLDLELERAFRFAEGKFEQALEQAPGQAEATAHLADMHWGRYRQARAANDHRGAAGHLQRVRRLASPAYAGRLEEVVPLTLRTHPEAEVWLAAVDFQDRVLVPGPDRPLGRTPLVEVPIPTGRQRLLLRAPGRRPVILPLMLWPGDAPRFEVPLYEDAVLGDDFAYVPAGEFVRGNDPAAVLANPGGLVSLPAFAIQRFPVTVGAYFEFLTALGPAEAARHQPREPRVGPLFALPPSGRWQAPLADVDGDLWAPGWPICSVSFADAQAYAAWRGARDGARYRLPTEDEWEKAARGTDGRKYPWGDDFDPTFCAHRAATPGNLLPKPVGAFPTDRSVYGVHDLAGGVREWTDSWFEAGQRVIRGGAFNLYPFLCRAASRWGAGPATTQSSVGFRLVKALPGA